MGLEFFLTLLLLHLAISNHFLTVSSEVYSLDICWSWRGVGVGVALCHFGLARTVNSIYAVQEHIYRHLSCGAPCVRDVQKHRLLM